MGKMNFGFTAVQAGQKSTTVNAEPRLIANSTVGKFVVTSPVSKALGVAVGENIQFLNNIPDVEAAIASRNEVIVNWAAENGVDLDTREGQDAALQHFTVWAIAKGVLQYNQKGEPVMGNVRYTKEEKVQALMNNDEARANMAEILGDDNFTAEHLIDILKSDAKDEYTKNVQKAFDEIVQSPVYHAATGSKTSTTGSATGVGCQLNFTDTAIWGALKINLGENKDKKNRNFRVCLDDSFETEVHDGCKTVKITAFPIEYIDDTDPIVRGEKQ